MSRFFSRKKTNNAESIKIGDVRTVTKIIYPERGETIGINKEVSIVDIVRDVDNTIRGFEIINLGREETGTTVSVDQLLKNTQKKDPIPIQIGTRFIATKDYKGNFDLYHFNKGDILVVSDIFQGDNPNTDKVYMLHIVDEYYVNDRDIEEQRFTRLNGSQLSEYARLDETKVGGKRKSNTFLKKQKKSKKNYMRAMRNFITRKRRKRVVS